VPRHPSFLSNNNSGQLKYILYFSLSLSDLLTGERDRGLTEWGKLRARPHFLLCVRNIEIVVKLLRSLWRTSLPHSVCQLLLLFIPSARVIWGSNLEIGIQGRRSGTLGLGWPAIVARPSEKIGWLVERAWNREPTYFTCQMVW